jgi:hypothetical protein
MPANYDADNSNNWEQIYNGSFSVTYVPGKQVPIYTPIPKTILPVQIDAPLIAIYCESTQYSEQKKYLGNVYQAIVGNGVFPTSTATAKGRAIYSNETVLAEFVEFDDFYQIVLNPRFWVEHLDVTIFKYLGEPNYEVNNRLTTIEEKLDRLL